MSKHTPGPWRMMRPSERPPDNNWHVTDEGDAFVAHVFGFNHSTDDIADINAHLIAAAPAMLEALEAVAPLLHWLDQEQNVTIAGDMLPKVLAAIAAAKGADQ